MSPLEEPASKDQAPWRATMLGSSCQGHQSAQTPCWVSPKPEPAAQKRLLPEREDRKSGACGEGMMGVVSELASSGSSSLSSLSRPSARAGMILTRLSSKCTCFFGTSEAAGSRISSVGASGCWEALGFLGPFRMHLTWVRRELGPFLRAPWKV